MIASITGVLAARDGETIVVQTDGGVGYEVTVPLGVAGRLPPTGGRISLHTELVVKEDGWSAPLYWESIGGEWWEFTLGGLRPLDPAAPVSHVSYYEAEAYAAWAGCRLPTEAEWELAASASPVRGNLREAGFLHPVAAAGDTTQERPQQIYGDVWEHTGSAYLPYPGYRAAPGALGEYNGKFMCGQMVLRGGSCATPTDHIRPTYRNFFYPHERWQFQGLRLAADA